MHFVALSLFPSEVCKYKKFKTFTDVLRQIDLRNELCRKLPQKHSISAETKHRERERERERERGGFEKKTIKTFKKSFFFFIFVTRSH
jgi:hypothetical protein